MSIRDFNWKQFFIEKGERVGLAITAVLMLVITVVSLFLPNHGFLVPAPGDNAKQLNDASEGVTAKQASARPTDADKPPAIGAVPVSFESGRIDDPKEYEVAHIFLPPPAGSTKRRMPELYNCVEGAADIAFSQIRSYIFAPLGDKEYGTIMVLEGGAGGAGNAPGNAGAGGTNNNTAAAAAPPQNTGAFLGGFGNRGGGLVGGGGPQVPGGGGPIGGGVRPGGGFGQQGAAAAAPGGIARPVPGQAPGMQQRQQQFSRPGQVVGGGDGRVPMKTTYVEVDKITENALPRFAEKVLPLRQAIICASFPYRKQVEEFQHKLHLPSPYAVLDEMSEDVDEDGNPVPAFHFLGVDVQRRVIGLDGKPVDNWQTLDLTGSLRPFIIQNGTRFEPDPSSPPEISSLIIDGLWMPLLRQFDEENPHNVYPKVENRLTTIQKTLQDLKGKEADQIEVRRNPITDTDKFNPFRRRGPSAPRPAAAAPAGDGGEINLRNRRAGNAGGGQRRRPATRPPGDANRPNAQPQANEPADGVLPENVLVRVVDVTIEPGKIYEYRLHVRMANPNFRRFGDVLSPSYAVDKELRAEKERKDSDWFVVPTKVSVPAEFFYYAVDQKELEGALYGGINAKATPNREQQAVFQAHRWLEDASREGNLPIWVGEWTVAERVLVSRGEFIGRTVSVAVPIWKRDVAAFVLAKPPTQPGVRRRDIGIDVDFSSPSEDSVLVDFDGGPQHFERKVRRDDKAEVLKIDERVGNEVLLVSNEGRITARNSAYDSFDKERIERLQNWRERIVEVLRGSLQAPVAGGAASPFAPQRPAAAPGIAPGGAGAVPGRAGGGRAPGGN